jgi:glycosyltransferase involved in cell wall biosynthesis
MSHPEGRESPLAVTGGGWPMVSVVLPTHDRRELLASSVKAILDQRYPGDIECLVVFDRQNPEPLPVETRPGRDLRLLANQRTPGPAGAYNTGAMAARGYLLAFCDDDDEWLPDKIRLQVEALNRHREATVAIAGIYLMTRRPHARIASKDLLTVDDVLLSPRFATHSSTYVARRVDFLSRIGPFDEATPGSYGEDVEWLVRAARLGPVLSVRKPLVRVRVSHSYFSDRWNLIIEALDYMVRKVPELHRQPRSLSKIYGRMAFGHAVLRHPREARACARKSIRLSWRQPLGYLAMLVSFGILSPRAVIRLAHAAGRGV